MLIMPGKYPNQIVNIWILKCINSLYSDFILYIPCCRVLFLTGNKTPFSTQVRVHHLLLNPARMGTGLTEINKRIQNFDKIERSQLSCLCFKSLLHCCLFLCTCTSGLGYSYSVLVLAVLEYWIYGTRTVLVLVSSKVVVLILVLVLVDKYSGTRTSTGTSTDNLWYICNVRVKPSIPVK